MAQTVKIGRVKGSMWYTGISFPQDGILDGDMFLNKTDAGIYQYKNNVWELVVDLNLTKQYIDKKMAELVDSAPETLDTLNELSKSLGNDPNFATTVANQIGKKANKDDVPTKLSQLEQDIELGVEESDVLNIIDNNSQDLEEVSKEVEELTFGNSSSVNWEDDTQVPSSKSVKGYVDSVLGDIESLLGGI